MFGETAEPTVNPDALTDIVTLRGDGVEVEIPNMSGEQFAWHMQAMMEGMVLLAPKLEALVRDRQRIIDAYGVSDAEIRDNVWDSFGQQTLSERDLYARQLALHTDIVNFTARLFGDDWEVVFVEHRNAVALAYRLGEMDPGLAKTWYNDTALVLQTSQSVVTTIEEYERRLAEIHARWNFWTAVRQLAALPAQLFRFVLEAVASFAAAALRAVGTALAPVGRALGDTIWELLKSFAVPVLVIGGVVIGGPYVWRFAQANWANARTPKLPPAAIEEAAEAVSQAGLRRRVRRQRRRV